MAVTIEFDGQQQYQLDAIDAVVGLLDGVALSSRLFDTGSNTLLTDDGVGNAIDLDAATFSENLRKVQEQSSLPDSMRLGPGDEIDVTEFSIEMETGTGKTYVYLRTIMELNKKFGLKKFIVVVPSVAIREGVCSNLRLLKDHFELLYDGVTYHPTVYDAKKMADVRTFAREDDIRILVLNIDAFNKDTNLINRPGDATGQVAPIELVQMTNPVVVLDEPQNLEGDAARQAIASLQPSMVLRYSATHRSMPNPVYRLTPVDAYNEGLVKKIDVWPVVEEEDLNQPFIRLESVKATARAVAATITIDVSSDAGTKREKVRVAADKEGRLPDLFDLSGERVEYRGYSVEEITARPAEITFANGVTLATGEEIGTDPDAVQRMIIRTAVEQTLEKERDFHARSKAGSLDASIKPLCLFFIDRVANYAPDEGKFRQWFIEAYEEIAAKKRYASLGLPAVEDVHAGYFAEDRYGKKDSTTGKSQADEAAYQKIMVDKEALLAPDEPLRFIWSHSALREGWDNPNVFVIATLNETKSVMKKRQEIGRGMRLPVMENGLRCRDPEVARLLVVANESYDDFASNLQKEIEEETSVTFDKRQIGQARKKRPVTLKADAKVSAEFKELWRRIARHTSFDVTFNVDRVVDRAALTLSSAGRISPHSIRVSSGAIEMSEEDGVTAVAAGARQPTAVHSDGYAIPDLLAYLGADVSLSRSSIAKVLIKSGRLSEIHNNPQRFIEQAREAIEDALAEEMLSGITYSEIPGGEYSMELFATREATSRLPTPLTLAHSALSEVVYESDVEENFARALDQLAGIKWFIKLPHWYKVATPIGTYNPDWGIAIDGDDDMVHFYLVRETKGTLKLTELRPSERRKIEFGKKHYEAISVDYEVVVDASALRTAAAGP